MQKCCLDLCESNTDSSLQSSVSYFCFPKCDDAEVFNKWVEALKKPPELFKGRDCFICSRHFRSEDLNQTINNLVLAKGAVPSLYLDGNRCNSDNSTESELEFADMDRIKVEPDEYIDYSELSLLSENQSAKEVSEISNVDKNGKSDSEDEDDDRLQIDLPAECEICCDFQMQLRTLKKDPAKAKDLKAITQDFDIHQQSHDLPIEKKFSCADCGENFAWANELRRHKLNMHGSFKCDHCHKRFVKLPLLRQHRQIKHNIIEVYSCELCNNSFFKVKELQKHLRIHQTKCKCDRCNKWFENSKGLEDHKCIERPFKCNICNKNFRAESNVDHHKAKYHTGKLGLITNKKKYSCKYCSKSFKTSESLEVHNQSHKKTYKCETCGKQFKVASHRKYHELLHTGVACYDLGKLKC